MVPLSFLILFFLGLGACTKSGSRTDITDVEYWTCAMHPSVHSDAPGACPICGMDLILIPVTKGKALAFGILSWTLTFPNNPLASEVVGTSTVDLQKFADGWKIVVLHTSFTEM